MIKLIASDIDGTLINSNHEVSDYTKKIIHEARKQGIQFALATGRDHESASGIARQLGIEGDDTAIICLNGLRVDNDSRDYHYHAPTMTYEDCELKEAIGNKYFMGVLYCFEDKIYYHMDDVAFQDYQLGISEQQFKFFNESLNAEKITGLKDIKHLFETGHQILKMVYIQNGDYTELVKERIAKEFDSRYNLLIVGDGWAEIMPRSVNKGDAILNYAASLGIKPEEVMTFGDSDNDLTMIAKAGCGVAMANARENLKTIADAITLSNDEDGVAHYIATHVLHQD